MYENIVVGTDGSETARIAVQRALDLAKAGGATLHVVHAYQPLTHTHVAAAGMTTGPTIDVEQVNSEIAENARALCLAAVGETDAKVEVHGVPGEAADAIVNAAAEFGADLLVVGNRGMSGKRRFILGSVPNKVSHHAPCDILIVDTTK